MAKLYFGLSALLLCPSVLAQSPMETIAKIWNSKVQLAADVSQFAGASSVLRTMAHMPGPDVQAHANHLDPEGPVAQCDRDFGMLCPSKFVNIGAVKGGQDPMCAGSEDCHSQFNFPFVDHPSLPPPIWLNHDMQSVSRTTRARARVLTPSRTCRQGRRASGARSASRPGRARPARMITGPPARRAGSRRRVQHALQLLHTTDLARMQLISVAIMPRCEQHGRSNARPSGVAWVRMQSGHHRCRSSLRRPYRWTATRFETACI